MTSLDGALCMPVAILTIRQVREVNLQVCGNPHKGNLLRGLSRVRGNSQARF
jgi:hypothetical protein